MDIFLLPFGSFIYMRLHCTSECDKCISFYSLLGVSQIGLDDVAKTLQFLQQLSTPFWEFLKQHDYIYSLKQLNKLTFYSLLGVSEERRTIC